MQAVIVVGEVRIGDGCIHQADFAEALGAERLTSIPKNFEPNEVAVIVGKPLRGKMPAIVDKAKAKEITVLTVDDVLDAATGTRIVELLNSKAKLEKYEAKATRSSASVARRALLSSITCPRSTHRRDVFIL